MKKRLLAFALAAALALSLILAGCSPASPSSTGSTKVAPALPPRAERP